MENLTTKIWLDDEQVRNIVWNALDKDDTIVYDYLVDAHDCFNRFILPYIEHVCLDEELMIIKEKINDLIIKNNIDNLLSS